MMITQARYNFNFLVSGPGLGLWSSGTQLACIYVCHPSCMIPTWWSSLGFSSSSDHIHISNQQEGLQEGLSTSSKKTFRNYHCC